MLSVNLVHLIELAAAFHSGTRLASHEQIKGSHRNDFGLTKRRSCWSFPHCWQPHM